MKNYTIEELLLKEIEEDEREYCFDRNYCCDKVWEEMNQGVSREEVFYSTMNHWRKVKDEELVREVRAHYDDKYDYLIETQGENNFMRGWTKMTKYNIYDEQLSMCTDEGITKEEIIQKAFDIITDRSTHIEDEYSKELKKVVEKGIDKMTLKMAMDILEDWEFTVSVSQ